TIAQPAAIIIPTSSNTPVCAGNTLNLSASANGGNGSLSYSWSGPNEFTSILQNPSIADVTTAATGTYTVTVTDANNCSVSVTTNATIITLPTITVGANPVVCRGITTANLPFSATSGSPNLYSIDYDLIANGAGFTDITNG